MRKLYLYPPRRIAHRPSLYLDRDAEALRQKQKVKLLFDESSRLSTWTADVCFRKRKRRKREGREEGQLNNTGWETMESLQLVTYPYSYHSVPLNRWVSIYS